MDAKIVGRREVNMGRRRMRLTEDYLNCSTIWYAIWSGILCMVQIDQHSRKGI